MKIVAVLLCFLLVIPKAYAHPETPINQLDKSGCHVTEGGNGDKHYHRENNPRFEVRCDEEISNTVIAVILTGLAVIIALAGVGVYVLVGGD